MEKGFSLIEVITAIFILTVGVGGAFSLIYQTLSTVYSVRSELTASFLAQEGVEIVKNLRDCAWLESRTATNTSWLANLSETPGSWEADYSDFELYRSYGSYLRRDSSGFFNYSSGETTNFKREIELDHISSTTVRVLVTVRWHITGRDKELQVVENITDWYGK